MHWLKENVYLASWLALPITVLIALIQRTRRGTTSGTVEVFPLKKVLCYLIFLICFPLTFSPWADVGTRIVSGFAAGIMFIVIMSASEKNWTE